MPERAAAMRCVVVERKMPHPPEKIGLALRRSWTLTPLEGGVVLRMEQAGFRPEDEANHHRTSSGWQRFVAGLERVAARRGSRISGQRAFWGESDVA